MGAGVKRNPLIVPLDVPQQDEALTLARALAPHVGLLKVGLESFVGYGHDFVRQVREHGAQVFLDLKLHDIPRTVEAAAKATRALDVQMLTVHASGGAEMVRAARAGAHPNTKILAVTVLTSLDATALSAMGITQPLEDYVAGLAANSLEAGADALVCSAHELTRLRELGGERVVPGIRPQGASHDDQKRVMTPSEALACGADWLVIGRPILRAEDPAAAAAKIVSEL